MKISPPIARLVLFAGAVLVTFHEVSAQPASECATSEDCVIEYDHLANQDSAPFLFLGKVVDETPPRWRDYRKEIRKFPDVRSCLTRDNLEGAPNLLEFDWKRVGTGDAAEVCILRIARSLGSINRITQWLEHHEFRSSGVFRYRSESYNPRFPTDPISHLTAWWSVDQYRRHNPSWVISLTGLEIINFYTLVVSYDQNNLVAGVSTGVRSKLN